MKRRLFAVALVADVLVTLLFLKAQHSIPSDESLAGYDS